jgi:hypothetical protein
MRERDISNVGPNTHTYTLTLNSFKEDVEYIKSRERTDRVFVILHRAAYPSVCHVALSQAKAEKWMSYQEDQHTYEISEWEPK